MSNIKEIDGVFINLDLVTEIVLHNNVLRFIFCAISDYTILMEYGNIKYKTKQEAEDRIRDILRMQNSPNIKI